MAKSKKEEIKVKENSKKEDTKSKEVKFDKSKEESEDKPGSVLKTIIIALGLFLIFGLLITWSNYSGNNYLSGPNTTYSDSTDSNVIEEPDLSHVAMYTSFNSSQCNLGFKYNQLWEVAGDEDMSEDIAWLGYYNNYDLMLRFDATKLNYVFSIKDYIFNMNSGTLDEIKAEESLNEVSGSSVDINGIRAYELKYLQNASDMNYVEVEEVIFVHNSALCRLTFISDAKYVNDYAGEIEEVKKTIFALN